MTARAFYRLATLGPMLGLAVAAAIARPEAGLQAGWDWMYPSSITRGLIAYSLLAGWLWWSFRDRSISAIERLMWWVPLMYVGLLWALMLGLALLRGRADELWAGREGAILVRTLVHLAVGYGYVALVSYAARVMRNGGGFDEATGKSGNSATGAAV